MIAHPDPGTFNCAVAHPGRLRRVFCDITMPGSSPAMADPRHVLKRALKRSSRHGVHVLHPSRDRVLPAAQPDHPLVIEPIAMDGGGYFDHTTMDEGTDFRRDAISMLEQMGISVEFSHRERRASTR